MKLKKPLKKRPETDEDDGDIHPRPISLLNRPRSWAIYGKSGSGKTTFAATFPKPILLLDVRDQGTDSIADHDDIDMVEIDSWERFEEAYYYLKANPKKYKTVVMDTITQLQQVCLEYVISDKKKDTTRVGDWGSMTKRDWGTASGLMKDWIINLRNLPMEVVFLAQERISATDEDEVDDSDNAISPEVGPHVMKSVAIALNAAVSVIANTFVRLRRFKKDIKGKKVSKEEIQYCLRVGPGPYYLTKLRKPKDVPPPAFIEDASYSDVIDVIKGK
jgi:phage nucleotide-binding protein